MLYSVNSYPDQLELGQVCKFRVEFDKKTPLESKGIKYCKSLTITNKLGLNIFGSEKYGVQKNLVEKIL